MSRKPSGERILGPYAKDAKWRVVQVDAAGKRESVLFDTEQKAERYIEILRADLDREEHTTATALVAYKVHLTAKGNKEASIEVTAWAIDQFFPTALPLQLLSETRCTKLYEALRTRTSSRTKKPLAADTHRNLLAQAKSFLAWCVDRGWLRANPCAGVKGIGKRRPRGKSLGKSGNTLRVREARAWYVKALALATLVDEKADTPAKLDAARRKREGATAALVAMLLGMRASEIVSRRVADLDEDGAPGDLLWIPCAKTPAGRRTLDVPEVLRPFLVQLADGKAPERFLFEAEDGKPH